MYRATSKSRLPNSVYEGVKLTDADSTRLLTVELADGDRPGRPQLRCELRSVRLEDKPKYLALSYSWRAPLGSTNTTFADDEREIICNGRPAFVLNNLFLALCRLARPPFRRESFWIDALCIHQQDDQERSQQVAIMGRIYSMAQRTVVWLGVDEGDFGKAADLIEALNQMPREAHRQVRYDTLQDTMRADADFLGFGREYWVALARFFRRAWFCRIWVVQEVLLSRSLQILCGDAEIAWDKITRASSLLSGGEWHKLLSDGQHDTARNDTLLLTTSYANPAKLAAAARDLKSGHLNTFLYCLIRSREYECSDLRDKVYSLHAAAHSQRFAISNPDYSATIESAYIEAAVTVLTFSRDLHILAHVEGRRCNGLVLPSWVPDWSCTEKLGLAITGYKRYSAAGSLVQAPVISADHRVLNIQAARIATISLSGESKRDVFPSRSFPRWIEVLEALHGIYFNGQHILEAFWRTLIRDTDEDRNCPADDSNHVLSHSFRAWVLRLARAKHPGELAPNASLTDALCVLHRSPELSEKLRTLASLDSTVANFLHEPCTTDSAAFMLAYHYRLYLRLFCTNEGYLGLGAEGLREGDSIWVVPGSRVPLILRQKTHGSAEKKYELVGGTYLHGLMEGEALTDGLIWESVDLE